MVKCFLKKPRNTNGEREDENERDKMKAKMKNDALLHVLRAVRCTYVRTYVQHRLK